MKNLTDLKEKRILIVGGESALEKVVVEQLSMMDAEVVVYNPNDENASKAQGMFDGMVFGIVNSDFRPLKMVSHDNMVQIMNQNFFLFIDVLRDLLKNKGLKENSSIVVYSSISSIHAMKAKMAFCSSKAALDAAVRCLAVELAPKGIRINSIQKGGVNADFEKSHIQSISVLNDNATENKQLLGMTSAVEIANMTGFLLSDAVKTMTGTSIVIDSGYTLM